MVKAPRRILLVDDHDDTRELAQEVLAGEGFDVVAVADGPEALAALREQRLDVVLTDLTLPTMSGEELAARVRGDATLAGAGGGARVIIVAVSGRDVTPSAAHLFDKVVRKPMDLVALAAELRAMPPRD